MIRLFLMEEGDSNLHSTRPLAENATFRYVISSAKSTFFVKAFSTGLLSAFAHSPKIAIREFEGRVSFTQSGANLAEAEVELRIRTDSLEAVDDISEKDRDEINEKMQREVLETDRFFEAAYQSSRVTASGSGNRYWASLQGDLTLHGETNPMAVNARVTIDGNSLRAAGEFSLRQSEYGIKLVSAAAGAIRVKDEVKCTFDIVALKQE